MTRILPLVTQSEVTATRGQLQRSWPAGQAEQLAELASALAGGRWPSSPSGGLGS
jgi:hypothetical protein